VTIKALAHEIGVSARRIRKWEAGDMYPNVEQSKRLLELINGVAIDAPAGTGPDRTRPNRIPPGKIRAIRRRLGLSRKQFARIV